VSWNKILSRPGMREPPALDFKSLLLSMSLWQTELQVCSNFLYLSYVSEAFVGTDNIMLSEKPLDHIDFVLGILKDENHNSRALGYLVARALLGRLSGQHQLSVAQRTIQAMAIETLSGMEDFMQGSDNLQSVRLFLHPSATILICS